MAYGSGDWELQEHGIGTWEEPSCCIIVWQRDKQAYEAEDEAASNPFIGKPFLQQLTHSSVMGMNIVMSRALVT